MTVFAQKWRGRVFSAVLVALVALALFSRVDAQSRVDKLKIAIKLVQDKIDLLKFEEALAEGLRTREQRFIKRLFTDIETWNSRNRG